MLFSVIVPIYNVQEYLERCLDSILEQTYRDFELILVDDGSTDECPAICDRYASRDSRIRVIHKPNGGLVSSRNVGLFAARGDYISYVDGDDWAKPRMLQFVAERLKESPVKLDMVLFAADDIYEGFVGKTTNDVPEGYYDKRRMEEVIYPYMLSDRRKGFHIGSVIHGHTWDKITARELVLEHYARDERIRMFTDVAYVYECLLYAENIYICNESLYNYNKTNVTSITAGKRIYLRESFTFLVSYMQSRMSGYSDVVDRQLNDYPVLLIIHDAIQEAKACESFSQAVKTIRERLDTSNMLDYVKLKGLPIKPKIFTALLKLHLDYLAMLLVKLS